MKPIIAVGLAIAFVAVACSDDDNVKPPQFVYPMTPGYTWYYTSTSISDYDTAQVIDDAGTVTVDIVDPDSAGELDRPMRFDVTSTFIQTSSPGAWFYNQGPAGMYLVASCGDASIMTPKRSGSGSDAFAGIPKSLLPDMLAGAGCGQSQIESWDDHPSALVYPWRVGKKWTYREPPATPLTIEKHITGYGTVTVPAGKFKAYHVVWSYDFAPDLHVADDIAEIGLVRRVVTLEHQTQWTYENPFAGSDYTAIQETVLDSVKIPTD
jgi:hypothetical protein